MIISERSLSPTVDQRASQMSRSSLLMMSTLFYLFLTFLHYIINICSDNKQLFPPLQLYLPSSQAFPLSLKQVMLGLCWCHSSVPMSLDHQRYQPSWAQPPCCKPPLTPTTQNTIDWGYSFAGWWKYLGWRSQKRSSSRIAKYLTALLSTRWSLWSWLRCRTRLQ